MVRLPQPEGCRCTPLYWKIMGRHVKRECPHMPQPYPGSPQAIQLGCICPPKQNANGEGVGVHEQHFYFVATGCLLHNGSKK